MWKGRPATVAPEVLPFRYPMPYYVEGKGTPVEAARSDPFQSVPLARPAMRPRTTTVPAHVIRDIRSIGWDLDQFDSVEQLMRCWGSVEEEGGFSRPVAARHDCRG